MKVLLELRPALDGHAGIPQETRLLFRGLARLEGVSVAGLLQSSNRMVAGGLTERGRKWPRHRQVDRQSKVVVALQRPAHPLLREVLLAPLSTAMGTLGLLLSNLVGRRQPLTHFDPAHFEDFIWRALFARTLPHQDFASVTSAPYRVARVPWSAAHAAALVTRRFGHALYPRLDTRGFDVMIAETPYPGRVEHGTRMVVRYHDAIPLLMPHTISDRKRHQASHYSALRRNIRDGAWFACVSDTTRRDLISVFPEAEPRSLTIHNMVSHHYFDEASAAERVPEILRIRRNTANLLGGGAATASMVRRGGGLEYLLVVSTIEPRKNHLTLLSAWEQLRNEGHSDLHLVIVGALGWDHRSIVRKFGPWLSRGHLHVLEDVPSPELRLLYKHARATICPSFGEGFDFSGVEAMRCGGVVAGSDIAVHRDIFGPAYESFSPYSAGELVHAVRRLIGPDSAPRREELLAHGREVSSRYLPERLLPKWQEFLASLKQAR